MSQGVRIRIHTFTPPNKYILRICLLSFFRSYFCHCVAYSAYTLHYNLQVHTNVYDFPVCFCAWLPIFFHFFCALIPTFFSHFLPTLIWYQYIVRVLSSVQHQELLYANSIGGRCTVNVSSVNCKQHQAPKSRKSILLRPPPPLYTPTHLNPWFLP